jgi:hypothetical protein
MNSIEEYQREIQRLQQNNTKQARELGLLFRAQNAERLIIEKDRRIDNLNNVINKLIDLVDKQL